MAAVRFEDEARTDPRFSLLGQKLGTSKFDARGRMIELWSYCTEKGTHFLSAELIDALAEFPDFSMFILDPSIAFAEKNDRGIRIKGLKGRIEWLAKLRNNSRKGGLATKKKAKARRQAKQRPDAGPERGPLTPTLTPTLSKKEERETGALIFELLEVWRETLRSFGIEPNIPIESDVTMGRILARHKDPENVRLALIGQRFEKDSPPFLVTDHLSLQRFLTKPQHFEKMMILGSREKPKTWERASDAI